MLIHQLTSSTVCVILNMPTCKYTYTLTCSSDLSSILFLPYNHAAVGTRLVVAAYTCAWHNRNTVLLGPVDQYERLLYKKHEHIHAIRFVTRLLYSVTYAAGNYNTEYVKPTIAIHWIDNYIYMCIHIRSKYIIIYHNLRYPFHSGWQIESTCFPLWYIVVRLNYPQILISMLSFSRAQGPSEPVLPCLQLWLKPWSSSERS